MYYPYYDITDNIAKLKNNQEVIVQDPGWQSWLTEQFWF